VDISEALSASVTKLAGFGSQKFPRFGPVGDFEETKRRREENNPCERSGKSNRMKTTKPVTKRERVQESGQHEDEEHDDEHDGERTSGNRKLPQAVAEAEPRRARKCAACAALAIASKTDLRTSPLTHINACDNMYTNGTLPRMLRYVILLPGEPFACSRQARNRWEFPRQSRA